MSWLSEDFNSSENIELAAGKIFKDDKGNRLYKWVTSRDEKYCHAKDRSHLLDNEIPQDYNAIFKAVKESGWDSAKILIIGEPGSGKTMSLNTLK